MGIDAGFDMVPQLTDGELDRDKWVKFIDFIKKHYQDDDRVEAKPNYIYPVQGRRAPKASARGSQVLTPQSKISGSIAKETRVEDYIRQVTLQAKRRFGSQTHHRGWPVTHLRGVSVSSFFFASTPQS